MVINTRKLIVLFAAGNRFGLLNRLAFGVLVSVLFIPLSGTIPSSGRFVFGEKVATAFREGDVGNIHTEFAGQASLSVVGIHCQAVIGETRGLSFYGTGAIIRKDGLILTSTSVVPSNATDINISLSDGRNLQQGCFYG